MFTLFVFSSVETKYLSFIRQWYTMSFLPFFMLRIVVSVSNSLYIKLCLLSIFVIVSATYSLTRQWERALLEVLELLTVLSDYIAATPSIRVLPKLCLLVEYWDCKIACHLFLWHSNFLIQSYFNKNSHFIIYFCLFFYRYCTMCRKWCMIVKCLRRSLVTYRFFIIIYINL